MFAEHENILVSEKYFDNLIQKKDGLSLSRINDVGPGIRLTPGTENSRKNVAAVNSDPAQAQTNAPQNSVPKESITQNPADMDEKPIETVLKILPDEDVFETIGGGWYDKHKPSRGPAQSV